MWSGRGGLWGCRLLTLALVLSFVSPALARVAAIETTAPLVDHSTEAVEAALTQAVLTAVRGAVAMGLTWVQVHQAHVYADVVSVQIVASDTEPDEADSADEDRPQPTKIDL
jgi:ABC-type polar amino acid transport system ATPase subunit